MGWFGNKNEQKQIFKPSGKLQTTPQVLSLGWLGVRVADVVAEALFMEQKLGLKFVDEGNSAVGQHHVRYDCGPLELELVTGGTAWATRPKPRHGQPDTPLIPSFSVDNIGRLVTQLAEREVEHTQIYEQGWAASFLFFDPERNLWQVSETRTEPSVATEHANLLAAIWLVVEDLPASVKFYSEVLGLPLAEATIQPHPIQAPPDPNWVMTPYAEGQSGWTDDDPIIFPPENERTDKIGSLGAVFMTSGTRLGLAAGGKRLEGGANRIWGQDTAFLPGLQTNDLAGITTRLHAAGIKTSGPYAHVHTAPARTAKAVRFHDPEGHCWQIFE